MGMNCDSCLSRCKGECCRGPIPMPATLLDQHPQIRPVTHVRDLGGGMVVAMHVDASKQAFCPFLGLDNHCSIYQHRPHVCQLFGSEVVPMMTCSYQDKHGRLRSRQERRSIERQHVSGQYKALNRILRP